MKKLGYNYCISYNSYRNVWVVFKQGDWNTSFTLEGSKISFSKTPKKAIKKYIKKYIKK